MAAVPYAIVKAGEWRHRLLHAVSGLLVFETLTGLSILFLPFSIPNQMMVLLHTVAGLVFVAPFLWYQLRHWRLYSSLRLSHVVLTGYFAMVASLVLVVSGLVLTAQALFTTRIGKAWDLAHIVATFALVLAVVPHVVTLVVRAVRASRAEVPAAGAAVLPAVRHYGRNTALATAGLFIVVLTAVLLYRPPELVNAFADDYSYSFGKDRPFAPSLASTTTGGAFDGRSLSGSKSC
ncbi:MAG TPA: hypothetical protein VF187_11260, partial [Gemmatimonadales bacterium]